MAGTSLLNNSLSSSGGNESLDTGVAAALLLYFVFILVLGVPGNCLILRVYWSKSKKSSTNVLIMGLALADVIVCLLRVWDVVCYSMLLSGLDIPDPYLRRFDCFVRTSIGTSVLITAAIAYDRYDCVCRGRRRIMTYGRAKKAILISLAASVVANIPLFVQVSSGGKFAWLELVDRTLRVTIFGAVLVLIAVCYGKVFLAVRRHVRLGVLPTGLYSDSHSQGRVETRTSPSSPTVSTLALLQIDIMSTPFSNTMTVGQTMTESAPETVVNENRGVSHRSGETNISTNCLASFADTIISVKPATLDVGELKASDVGAPRTPKVGAPEHLKISGLSIYTDGPKTSDVGVPGILVIGEPKAPNASVPKTLNADVPKSQDVGVSKALGEGVSKALSVGVSKKMEENITQTQDLGVPKTLELSVPKTPGECVPKMTPRVSPDHRRRQSTAPALQRRTTTMLFVTSLVFVLSWLPYWIVAVSLHVREERSLVLETLVNLLFINNAINPFIYGVANRRFRKDCRDALRKIKQCKR